MGGFGYWCPQGSEEVASGVADVRQIRQSNAEVYNELRDGTAVDMVPSGC